MWLTGTGDAKSEGLQHRVAEGTKAQEGTATKELLRTKSIKGTLFRMIQSLKNSLRAQERVGRKAEKT